MKTFLIEKLELPNFAHMTTSILLFESRESRDKALLVTSWVEIMTSSSFFKPLSFNKTLSSQFC